MSRARGIFAHRPRPQHEHRRSCHEFVRVDEGEGWMEAGRSAEHDPQLLTLYPALVGRAIRPFLHIFSDCEKGWAHNDIHNEAKRANERQACMQPHGQQKCPENKSSHLYLSIECVCPNFQLTQPGPTPFHITGRARGRSHFPGQTSARARERYGRRPPTPPRHAE